MEAWADQLVRRPGSILIALLLLTGLSVWGALRLTINTNQLDLISQQLRAIQDVKRVVDMVGGAGHLIIAFRGSDEAVLKQVADDMNAALVADTERIRKIQYKFDTTFLIEKAPLFVQTPDLEEIRRQVTAKIKDTIRRNSPFFVEIQETKPLELNLDPIIDKYKKVGKKSIADSYYISDDKQMVLLVVKPMWDGNELTQTGALVEKLRQDFAAWSASNAHGIHLTEGYDQAPAADGKAVTYGFTGSYKTNYDDSFQIQASLIPTGTWALLGIALVLAIFFGRRPGSVLLIVLGMAVGIVFTFGFAKATVGELNMVTSILAGILMGQGIDFGIHFNFRMREELGRGRSVDDAVRETLKHSGLASLVSAVATGSGFLALLFSEFRGFSQFGLLAGAGSLIIAFAILSFAPALLIWLGRVSPTLPVKLLGTRAPSPELVDGVERRVPGGRWLLVVAGAAALGLAAFAPQVDFEYNTRALMVENQPSVLLQDEINARFQISADPVAIYTRTTEEALKIFGVFNPLDRKRFSTVDQVVSMWSFVPPADQQARNVAVLQAWKKDLEEIEVDALPEEHQADYQKLLNYLDTQAYTLAEVPLHFREQFGDLPSTRPENRGYLTFLYPVVDLWDGKQMLAFADEVEDIHTPDGELYHAAGAPILFAHLARIVLWDGRFSVALTSVLLLIILLLDFRSLRSALVALIPLVVSVAVMLGVMAIFNWHLNFMNVVVLPIVLGYGISHGVYLMHRFNEGIAPMTALRSVGAAVAASTLTTLAGWAALLAAGHKGLKSMGILACVGMTAALLVSFTIMPAVLQILHDRRQKKKAPTA